MKRIPPAALLLALAGLIPFFWGVLLVLGLATGTDLNLPEMLSGDGRLVMVRYGGIILPFMSGVLWGFATRTSGAMTLPAYGLSVLPALWWFFMPGASAETALINLCIGFAALLLLDYFYASWRLAPSWWMSLRIPLTGAVLICLAIGAWA